MLLRSGPLRSPAKHLSTARGAPSASLTFLDLSWNAIGSKGGKVKNIFFFQFKYLTCNNILLFFSLFF